MWDTAGQERFRSMNMGLYYRGGQGAVIVYDVTNWESYMKAKESLAEVRVTLGVSGAPGSGGGEGEPWKRNGMVVALAGNKRDLVRGRTAGGIRGEVRTCKSQSD